MSDNRDYHNNHDYHLYEIDHNNPWSFDETRFAKRFARQEGRFARFSVFQRGQRAVEGQGAVEGTEGLRGNREPYKGQRAVEETEGRREGRGTQRGQMVIEGKRVVEETVGSREDKGLREDRWPQRR